MRNLAFDLTRCALLSAFTLMLVSGLMTPASADPELKARPPQISGGGQMSGRKSPQRVGPVGPQNTQPSRGTVVFPEGLGALGTTFEGPDFDDNGTENGTFYIPPDPDGAAGPDRVIAVVNTMIEARTKTGTLLFIDALKDFFSPLSPCALGTSTFDPKVIYDQYEDRFVVVTLERVFAGVNPSAGNLSRILVAVSKTSAPATATSADWWFHCIDSKAVIGGVEVWADYPGFEVDEEAIYITNNMFAFPGAAPTFGVRLWIIDKGVVGGFYAGSAASVSISDPYASGGIAVTTQPAQVFGAGGVGSGIGTFLVGYSSLTDCTDEFVQVMRVDDPLGGSGGPFFVGPDYINVGDLELVGCAAGFPDLPDAPQLGGPELIEVNDSRALDAVWRAGRLWLTSTINPNGTDVPLLPAHTTAWWFELNPSSVTSSASPAGLIFLSQQGGILGEELSIPPGSPISTFFPSVAVNAAGDAAFGFSASGASIYAGAYATMRQPADPPGVTQLALTLHTGRDYYVRTFDSPPCDDPPGAENRWGDYSGISLDPTNDYIFWVFNEFADVRGTATAGGCNGRPAMEDGRWATCWASFGPNPEISIDDVSLVEGDVGTTAYAFTASLNHATIVDVTFDYATSDGSATIVDNDYLATSGTATIPAGSTSTTVTVFGNGDETTESDESFDVGLSSPMNATFADALGVGTIENDDPLPQITIDDGAGFEGDSGSSPAEFIVSLSHLSDTDVTMDYATADGTAEAGEDYTAASGTLTISAMTLSTTFTVLVIGDIELEDDETFNVQLSAPSGGFFGGGSGLSARQIKNDDAGLTMGDVSILETNSGTTPMTFTVTVGGYVDETATVDFATADSTATTANNDYVSTTGTLTIDPVPPAFSLKWGSAGAGTGFFANPSSIALDPSGNVYVADEANHRIQVFSSGGTFLRTWGSFGTGNGQFNGPRGIAVKGTNVYVVDRLNHRIQRFTTGGVFVGTWGSNGTADGQFDTPWGIVVDHSGDVYVADRLNHRIQKFSVSGTFLSKFGSFGTGDGQFQFPQGLAVDASNNVYVSENNADRIQKFNGSGTFQLKWGSTGSGDGQLSGVYGLHVDDRDFVYAAENGNSRIQKFDTSGGFILKWGTSGTADGEFDDLFDVVVNDCGEVYTVEIGNDRVQRFDPALPANPTITVSVNGDTKLESDEFVLLNLSNPVEAFINDSQGVGTIQDDDATPSLSINDVTGSEGNSGTTTFDFTVTLSNQTDQDVTVDYTTNDSTATVANNDYVATSGTLTIPTKMSTGTISVTVNGDAIFESDETFKVDLSNPVNATISDHQGIGTIENGADGEPSISIADLAAAEGNVGPSPFGFTVTLSNPTDQDVTVDYTTNDGTATTANSDYTVATGTLTIPAKNTVGTITVQVTGDLTLESDETFTVDLSNPVNATISDNQATGTIQNDDSTPSITINDVAMSEGNSGSSAFTFSVMLTNPTDVEVTVDYTTTDVTATTSNGDYDANSGTLTIPAKASTGMIAVTVHGDETDEFDEDFTVDLSNAVNANISDNQGLGTIQDDDGTPTLSIDDVAVLEGDAGTIALDFTVTLSHAASQDVTVDYATSDVTATTANGDYTAATGTVTIAAKTTTGTITVQANGDETLEGDETFNVDLTNPVNASISDNMGVGTIQNDDVTPSLSIDDVSALEGDTGTSTYNFTVSLSNPSNQIVTVAYTTNDGSATTANGDYVATSGTLTISPKTTSGTIAVTVNGDQKLENDDEFTVDLSSSSNATISDSQGLGTIQNDDGAPSLSITDVSAVEGNSGTSGFAFTVSLSIAAGVDVTVDYTTTDGTALTADNDYVANSGTLTISAKAPNGTITVQVNGDNTIETYEYFSVELSNPVNATLADIAGVGTIEDDDGATGISDPTVTAFSLGRVTPNPSHGNTRTEFTIPREARIRLTIVDIMGHQVAVLAEGVYQPGRYQGTWNGRASGRTAAPGVYFVRYQTPDHNLMKRFVFMR